jgi:hypothetical protein
MLYELIAVVCTGSFGGSDDALTSDSQVRPGNLQHVKEYVPSFSSL